MNKDWLLTDTHFDHFNIGVYCDRPDGWMDLILKNWREIVKPEDTVWHLGDVQVGRKHPLLDLLNSLPGTKILIKGNHDTQSHLWYMRNGFAASMDAAAYQRVTLTHQPSNSLFGGTDLNIHGHVHNSLWTPTKDFQRLLAIEHVDYKPVDFMKWTNMARSPEKWAQYMKSWRVPNVTDKMRNSRNELLAQDRANGGRVDNAGVAQLVEPSTCNREVVGSSPTPGSNL